MTTIRADTIKNYLTDMSKASDYWLFGFVFSHGKQFGKLVPLPDGEEHGPLQQCFTNAFNLTNRHPELIYTEGFVFKVISASLNAIESHAWAVDEKGNAYDPTLEGEEYFGIPFKRDYVQETIARISLMCTSLLENTVEDYPLMRGVGSEVYKYESDSKYG